MLDTLRALFRLTFLQAWGVANGIGYSGAVFLFTLALVELPIIDFAIEILWFIALLPLLVGVVLGISQWIVLRHYFRSSVHWILVTAIGAFLGAFAPGMALAVFTDGWYFPLDMSAIHPIGWIVGSLIFGSSLGIFQFAHAPKGVNSQSSWIAAALVGGAVAYCITVLGLLGYIEILAIANYPPRWSNIVSDTNLYGAGFIAGALGSVPTGLWLSRQRHTS